MTCSADTPSRFCHWRNYWPTQLMWTPYISLSFTLQIFTFIDASYVNPSLLLSSCSHSEPRTMLAQASAAIASLELDSWTLMSYTYLRLVLPAIHCQAAGLTTVTDLCYCMHTWEKSVQPKESILTTRIPATVCGPRSDSSVTGQHPHVLQ